MFNYCKVYQRQDLSTSDVKVQKIRICLLIYVCVYVVSQQLNGIRYFCLLSVFIYTTMFMLLKSVRACSFFPVVSI